MNKYNKQDLPVPLDSMNSFDDCPSLKSNEEREPKCLNLKRRYSFEESLQGERFANSKDIKKNY